MPQWDLNLVLTFLMYMPSEPMHTCSLRLKTVFTYPNCPTPLFCYWGPGQRSYQRLTLPCWLFDHCASLLRPVCRKRKRHSIALTITRWMISALWVLFGLKKGNAEENPIRVDSPRHQNLLLIGQEADLWRSLQPGPRPLLPRWCEGVPILAICWLFDISPLPKPNPPLGRNVVSVLKERKLKLAVSTRRTSNLSLITFW